MSREKAEKIFKDRFRVRYNFDGVVSSTRNENGENRRAVGYDADSSLFTWKKFISLDGSYNPTPGELNPWSLKKWYMWGCRKFHLHCPFGKVSVGNEQGLVYEVDQFLNAKNGLSLDGKVQNTPMPWLTNDFVSVFKALTTGQQGTLDSDTWNSWTIGKDAWFNPQEPIDVIVYVGGMAEPGNDTAYQAYLKRWNELFDSSYAKGLARLRNSVLPFVEANCRIAFDASVVSPGPLPGKNVSLDAQGINLQRGWWTFWQWLTKKIGKSRIYVESYPFKKDGEPNPYLGYGIISDDDWSYSKWVSVGPNGPHPTSELGRVEFWRSIWQNTEETTPLIFLHVNGVDVPQRYSFLKDVRYAMRNKDGDIRLSTATCCSENHNYYYADIYAEMIAYHLLEKQHTRDEPNEDENFTVSGILVQTNLLQILPEAFQNDVAAKMQFGRRFDSASSFIDFLSMRMESRRAAIESVYIPHTK